MIKKAHDLVATDKHTSKSAQHVHASTANEPPLQPIAMLLRHCHVSARHHAGHVVLIRGRNTPTAAAPTHQSRSGGGGACERVAFRELWLCDSAGESFPDGLGMRQSEHMALWQHDVPASSTHARTDTHRQSEGRRGGGR